MKSRNYSLIFIFIIFSLYIFRKPLTKIEKNQTNTVNLKEKSEKNMEEMNKYNSYIMLYFKEDCNYSKGFKNVFRNDISFITNRKNNTRLTSKDVLIINKKLEIEIHFNNTVKYLASFFDQTLDKNMKY